LPYIPRETNIIQTILKQNYTDFDRIYFPASGGIYMRHVIKKTSTIIRASLEEMLVS
jgi:hypothetical protein